MEATVNHIKNNWPQLIWVAGIIFVLGGIYGEFRELHKDQKNSDEKLEALRKQVWDEIEQRVDDLEEWREYTKGYEDARNNK